MSNPKVNVTRAKLSMAIRKAISLNQLERLVDGIIDMVMNKNHDYGDAWQRYGIFTPLIRLNDKLLRVENLSDGKPALVAEEYIGDTLRDIIGYCSLALLWLDDKKFQELLRAENSRWVTGFERVGQKFAVLDANSELKSILDTHSNKMIVCDKCGWSGVVSDAVPNVDGKGSFGCPKCRHPWFAIGLIEELSKDGTLGMLDAVDKNARANIAKAFGIPPDELSKQK